MAANLQEQRDMDFADPEDMELQDQAKADLANQGETDETGGVDFADEPDDYPAPPAIEDDGKGKAPVNDFADVGEGTGKPAQVKAPSQSERRDIHTEQDGGDEQEGPAFSNDLLGRAHQYGVAPDQAQQMFQSPEELEAALLFMDQKAMNDQAMWQQQQQQAYQQQQQQYTAQQQAVRQPVMQPQQQVQDQQQQAVETPAQEQQNLYELKNEDLFDPSLTEDLHGMQNHLIGIIQGQQQTMEQLQQQSAYQQQAMQQWMQQQMYDRAVQEFEEFDEFVTTLGDDWSDMLGDGRSQELPPNSPQLINRQRLFETANNLRQLHANQGRNVSLKAATPNALKMAFPDRNQTTTAWNQPARDQQGRFTARPAKRKQSPNGNKREQMLSRWDNVMHKAGYPLDHSPEFQDGV